MGRYQEAKTLLDESLSIAREIGDKVATAVVLQPLGSVSYALNDLASSRRHYEESVALSRELGDKRRLSIALNSLAELHRTGGELDLAARLYAEALALARELGDRESIAVVLLNLARVELGRGGSGQTPQMLLEVLHIADETGSKRLVQVVLEVAAGLAAFLRDWERAARLNAASDAHMLSIGVHRDAADEAFLAPLLAQTREELGADAFAAAESAGRALGYDEALADARAWLVAISP